MSEVGARAGAGQAPLGPSSTVLAQNVGQWTPCKIREDSAQLPPPGLWCMDQSPAPRSRPAGGLPGGPQVSSRHRGLSGALGGPRMSGEKDQKKSKHGNRTGVGWLRRALQRHHDGGEAGHVWSSETT